MKELQIALLGGFRVTVGEELVTNFPTDATRALLIYLATNPQTLHSRVELGTFLWPDQPESEVLNNLRQTLIRLRRVLPEHDDATDFLEITRQTLRFNPQSDYTLDVARFQALVAETQAHPHRRVAACPHCIRLLKEAAQLYRGDFLAGFSFDSLPFEEWMVLLRERLHRQVMVLLHQLTTYSRHCGDYRRAQEYAQQQLHLEPWNEEAHGQLMHALAISGQRSAALTQYELCRRNLAEELNVEPGLEIRALYRRIRDGVITPEDTPLHNLPIQLTTFVGREAELEQLRVWLADSASHLVTIAGDSGMGKTRLALAAAQEMRGCFADGVWFVPLADIEAPEAAPRNPSEGTLIAAIAASLNISAPSHTLQEDLRQRVLTTLQQQELLLVLDHLKPALLERDAAFLLRMLRQCHKMMLLVTAHHRLNFQTERVLHITGMDIPPSAQSPDAAQYDSVRLFVERARHVARGFVLDDTTLPAILRICRAVAGNPLGIELATVWMAKFSPSQIARAIEQDMAQLTTQAWDVPERHQSLQAVFVGTWRGLSPVERGVLTQLAIFRGSFSREAAEVVIAHPLDGRAGNVDIARVLETLIRRALLQETAGQRYQLTGLLRQFARQQLDALEASQIAQLHERHSDFFLTLLGRCGAMYGTPETGKAHRAVAADWSNIRPAWDWAVRHKNAALLDVALDGLHWYMYGQGLIEDGEATLEVARWRLRSELETPEVPRVMARFYTRLLIAQAHFRNHLAQYDRAREALQTASELWAQQQRKAAPAPMWAEIQLQWGVSLRYQADYAEARQRCHEALELVEEGSGWHIYSLQELSRVAASQTELPAARALAMQALQRCEERTLPLTESVVLNWLGDLAIQERAYTEAVDHLDRSLRLCLQVGNRFYEQRIRYNLARLWRLQGNYSDALRSFERVLKFFQNKGARRDEGLAWMGLGHVTLQLGDFERAHHALGRALHISEELATRDMKGEVLGLLTNLACQWGRPQAASGYSMRAVHVAQEVGNRALHCQLLIFLGHTWYLLHQPHRAGEVYYQAQDLHQEIGYARPNLDILTGLAAVALAEDDTAAMEQHVHALLEIHAQDPTLTGVENPGRSFLTAIRVLRALHDPRATECLDMARAWLMQRSANINDPAARQTFMENVPAHRELLRLH